MGNMCPKADEHFEDVLELAEMNSESPSYSKTCKQKLRSLYNKTMKVWRGWSKEPAGFDCAGRMSDANVSRDQLNRLLRQCDGLPSQRRRRSRRG